MPSSFPIYSRFVFWSFFGGGVSRIEHSCCVVCQYATASTAISYRTLWVSGYVFQTVRCPDNISQGNEYYVGSTDLQMCPSILWRHLHLQPNIWRTFCTSTGSISVAEAGSLVGRQSFQVSVCLAGTQISGTYHLGSGAGDRSREGARHSSGSSG